MARKSSPPLYELISARSGEPSYGSRPVGDAADSRDVPAPTRIGPGRQVQFPVGYLFVAAAAVLVLLAFAYMAGYSRGDAGARMILEEDIDPAVLAARNGSRARDPLDQARSPVGAGGRNATVPGAASGGSEGGRASWGPVEPEVDPRQRGLSYFTLATTRKAGATRLAEFCRERGLETYVVPDNNPGLWRVIALPGFDPSETTGPQARRMREKIYEIGDVWKNHEPGATNLRDANPLPHRR